MENIVFNKNCFEGFKEMTIGLVDHVVTSPPYNRKRNDKYNNYNDTLVDYKEFLLSSIKESMRVSKGFVFYNIQKNYYNKKEVFEIIGELSEYLVDIIIWSKDNPMPASGFNITNAYEFLLVFSDKKTSLKSNETYTKNLFSSGVYSKNEYSKIHRAVMHPDFCEWIIKKFTNEGDLILDPFSGVGTTAVTCLKNNRKTIGYEMNKEYSDICNERIKKCLTSSQ